MNAATNLTLQGPADPLQVTVSDLVARPKGALPPPPGGKKPILCVDFDGVLHAYTSGWKGADVVADGPVDGAIAFLWEMIPHFDVQIYSSRSKEPGGIDAMRQALKRWEILEFAAWHDKRQRGECETADMPSWTLVRFRSTLAIDHITFPKFKPAAFLTIDDRAVCFEGIFPPAAALLAFQPWNKR